MEPPPAEQIVAPAQGAAMWLAKEHSNQQELRTIWEGGCHRPVSISAGAVARPGSCARTGGGGYRVHKRALRSENQDHTYNHRFVFAMYPSIPRSSRPPSSNLMNSIEEVRSSVIRAWSATNIVPCNGGLWRLWYRDKLARC